MRKRYLPLLAALALGLVACGEEAPEVEERAEGGVEFTDPQQIHSEGTLTPERAEVPPEQRAQEFFQALQQGQIEQAATLVARNPLDVGEQELLESLRQWTGETAGEQQEFEIIDSHETGDFALVRARFMPANGTGQEEAVRPVVMFLEEGEWKVVWELLGLEPERVAEVDPASAQRLEPLYDWYDKQQLYDTQQAGGGQQGEDAQQAEGGQPTSGAAAPSS